MLIWTNITCHMPFLCVLGATKNEDPKDVDDIGTLFYGYSKQFAKHGFRFTENQFDTLSIPDSVSIVEI